MVTIKYKDGSEEKFSDASGYEVKGKFVDLYGPWVAYEKPIGTFGIFPFNGTRYEMGQRREVFKTLCVSDQVTEIING